MSELLINDEDSRAVSESCGNVRMSNASRVPGLAHGSTWQLGDSKEHPPANDFDEINKFRIHTMDRWRKY